MRGVYTFYKTLKSSANHQVEIKIKQMIQFIEFSKVTALKYQYCTLNVIIEFKTLLHLFSDSKSCLSGLNWPRSGKKSEFLALFWLVEGTLGIGWK